MSTTYVVLEQHGDDETGLSYDVYASDVEAHNAEHACRSVAGRYTDEALAEGLTLIAVPARNWTGGRHTLKAETTRRIRSA